MLLKQNMLFCRACRILSHPDNHKNIFSPEGISWGPYKPPVLALGVQGGQEARSPCLLQGLINKKLCLFLVAFTHFFWRQK